MKNILLLLLLVFLVYGKAWTQVSVTGYSLHAVGINTDQTKRLSGELKAFTNTERGFVEGDVLYNLEPKDRHQLSFGIGITALSPDTRSYLSSIVVPIQLQVYPLKEFRRLSVLLELAPEYVGHVGLRSLWGIRYKFGE